MIITIDGPAGTGKSTAARGLAERLGFEFLDTGAMYRVVALLCLDRGIDPADEIAAARLAAGATIEFHRGRTLAGGVDVTDRLRTPQVSQAASLVAQVPAVREELVRQQRRLAAGLDIVCEGRDQGTVAFPHAECKFFITADPVERARRRQQELAETGRVVSLEDLLAEQAARDQRDENRAVAPLKPAPDAIRIDTTALSADAVLDALEQHVRRTQ
jgi:cytidylate kinase